MRKSHMLQPAISSVLLGAFFIACGGTAGEPPVAAPPTPEPIAATTIVGLQPATPLPLEPATPLPGVSAVMPDFFSMTLPEEVAKQADLIVMGTTVGPQTTGQLPPGSPLAPPEPPGEPSHPHPWVYTETPVQVERALKGKGKPLEATVRVRTLGGTAGGVAVAVTHQAELRVGQRVVLFLKQIEPEYYAVLGEDGVYEVVGEEAIGVRHRFPLADLLARIENSTR